MTNFGLSLDGESNILQNQLTLEQHALIPDPILLSQYIVKSCNHKITVKNSGYKIYLMPQNHRYNKIMQVLSKLKLPLKHEHYGTPPSNILKGGSLYSCVQQTQFLMMFPNLIPGVDRQKIRGKEDGSRPFCCSSNWYSPVSTADAAR